MAKNIQSKKRVQKRSSLTVKRKGHKSNNESREITEAIRRGQVDAFVTEGATGHQVLVLQGANAHKSEQKESEEIADAIRRGQVDAFVTEGTQGDQVVILQDAEHPYRILVESVSDGAAMLDSGGTILYANKRLAKILEVPHHKLMGTLLQKNFAQDEGRGLSLPFNRGLRANSKQNVTFHLKTGKPRTVRFSFSVVTVAEQPNICVVATELTDLLEARDALVSNEESLRNLTARLLRIQDEERRHIARDLHDATGQKLALQSMTLSRLLKRSSDLDDEYRTALVECSDLTKQISDEVRTLSYLLHPPLLDELGLTAGVKWYVEGFGHRTGINVEVSIPSDLRRLPPDVELTFFRIVQESLSNVHRYSGCTKAYVRIRSTEDEVEVKVGDFGKGMRPDLLNDASGAVAPVGVGIQGMKERMRQLSGTLGISSQPNKGTVVTATLSIPRVRPTEEETRAGRKDAGVDRLRSSESGSLKRILIADDHETLRRGLRTMLASEPNWEICGEAIDGKDTVDKVIRLNPDLVILDINMPALNGLSVIRKILSARPQTKILVFTVHDSVHIVKEIQAAGAHGYLPKNRAGDELLNLMKNILTTDNIHSFAVAGRS